MNITHKSIDYNHNTKNQGEQPSSTYPQKKKTIQQTPLPTFIFLYKKPFLILLNYYPKNKPK